MKHLVAGTQDNPACLPAGDGKKSAIWLVASSVSQITSFVKLGSSRLYLLAKDTPAGDVICETSSELCHTFVMGNGVQNELII